jgi:hypothetical protein
MNQPFAPDTQEAPLDTGVTELGDHIRFLLAYATLPLLSNEQLERIERQASLIRFERSPL